MVRSFAGLGIPTLVISRYARDVGRYSRYCDDWRTTFSNTDWDESRFLATLINIAEEGPDAFKRFTREVIEEGRLAGIKQADSGFKYDFIVTDDAANLRDYIRWGDDPFTEHFLTLRKILPKVPGQ